MVVTDAHLFPPSDMKVRITSWDGRDSVLDLQREWTVDKVKIVAMEHFLRPGDSMKASLYHKLLHIRLSKCLSDEMTLGQEGVKENGESPSARRAWHLSQFLPHPSCVCINVCNFFYNNLLSQLCVLTAGDWWYLF